MAYLNARANCAPVSSTFSIIEFVTAS